ncbi:MAG: glycosyltransferase family 4 protein [Tepidisphaeraceae bacterium]
MRIALVILHADPARGGAERYTVDLAAALARRGHDVSLVASSFAAPIVGVANVTLDSAGLTRAGRYRGFLNALDAHLAATTYDVVHAMLPVRRCDVYHPHAGIAAAAEQKWNIHVNPRRKRMAAVECELLAGRSAPITIALSEYVKRSIRAHYALPDNRLATLFNAVDLHRFDPTRPIARAAGREDFMGFEDRPVAIMVAQDFERKGLPAAIGALAQLPKAQRPFLFVVGKDKQPPFLKLAEQLGVRSDVAFDGWCESTERRYALAEFFVLPTKHDPCSLVVLEALAMGLPVISTVFNGATEIMTDGVHGYVLKDPTDVDALADAMRKLLDPERRRAMSEACLALRPKLSYEHHLDELMKIYDRARRRE